jgi:creatinine amidohydrolase
MLRLAFTFMVSTGCMMAAAPAKSPAPDTKVSTRDLDRINWMEFREVVPKKIDTVLLPTGTLEPHGVTANGADNIAPRAIAFEIAGEVDAMVAPTLPYGITGSMSNYPGAFQISADVYRPFVKQVIEGLADNGFRNIVIINGHGGPQTAVLQSVAAEVANERRGTRTLVVNWWSYASEITKDVFGEDGGHAGLNETAFMQAIDPKLVHPDRYSEDMATAYPQNKAWSATPFPTSIGLYKEGEGYPDFDQKKAERYYQRVNAALAELIRRTIRQWNAAGV